MSNTRCDQGRGIPRPIFARETVRERWVIDGRGAVNRARFSPVKRYANVGLSTVGARYTAPIFARETGRERWVIDGRGAVHRAQLSGRGTQMSVYGGYVRMLVDTKEIMMNDATGLTGRLASVTRVVLPGVLG